ncbi:hypothetical protein M8C21_019698, partial [Ambrosia artemisiifolia]
VIDFYKSVLLIKYPLKAIEDLSLHFQLPTSINYNSHSVSLSLQLLQVSIPNDETFPVPQTSTLFIMASVSHLLFCPGLTGPHVNPEGICLQPDGGENGELRVGVRRFSVNKPPCHLRTSQFIISLNKYIEAVNNKFTAGMRFKMPFQGEDSPERRFTGTIVAVEDISPQWESSKWCSLKDVQVDAGNRPVTGLRLYLEGKKSNRSSIHLQRLSSVPNMFQLEDGPHENSTRESYDHRYYKNARASKLRATGSRRSSSYACSSQLYQVCPYKSPELGRFIQLQPNHQNY